MNTPPILFLIFNRPDVTQRVFDAIREARPKELFVAADGPRTNKTGEVEKCEACRKIIEQVDWDCEVKTLFRNENLGCKKAVSSAITWFFDHVDKGVILEDDCLPSSSFFHYCDELLNKYEQVDAVKSISGSTHIPTEALQKTNDSYYFSNYFHCWGWASWRRAWASYDMEMKNWPAFKKSKQFNQRNFWEARFYERVFDKTFVGKIDTWDYQMQLNVWSHNGLCLLPTKNMVSNIGFGEGATHTISSDDEESNKAREQMSFPLQHPGKMEARKQFDKFEQKKNVRSQIIYWLKSLVGKGW